MKTIFCIILSVTCEHQGQVGLTFYITFTKSRQDSLSLNIVSFGQKASVPNCSLLLLVLQNDLFKVAQGPGLNETGVLQGVGAEDSIPLMLVYLTEFSSSLEVLNDTLGQ